MGVGQEPVGGSLEGGTAAVGGLLVFARRLPSRRCAHTSQPGHVDASCPHKLIVEADQLLQESVVGEDLTARPAERGTACQHGVSIGRPEVEAPRPRRTAVQDRWLNR